MKWQENSLQSNLQLFNDVISGFLLRILAARVVYYGSVWCIPIHSYGVHQISDRLIQCWTESGWFHHVVAPQIRQTNRKPPMTSLKSWRFEFSSLNPLLLTNRWVKHMQHRICEWFCNRTRNRTFTVTLGVSSGAQWRVMWQFSCFGRKTITIAGAIQAFLVKILNFEKQIEWIRD